MTGNHRTTSDNGGCAGDPKALEVEICAKEAGDTVVVLHSNGCPSAAGKQACRNPQSPVGGGKTHLKLK